jgi:bacteriorhodopsin
MFQPIGSLVINLIILADIVFILALLIITPIKKSYLKWKWIGIGLMILGLFLKLMDQLT